MAVIFNILLWLCVAMAGILILLAIYSRWTSARVERQNPPAGKSTRVKGGLIHWTESGSGPPLVLIHGLGGNLHNFASVVPLLNDSSRVISIDRPGCGYSERDSDDYAALVKQADMIAAFLDAEGIERPTVVGHSLGGAVTLALAVNHPDKVKAMALLAPASHPMATPPDMFKPIDVPSLAVRKFLGATLAVPLGQLQTPALLKAVYHPEPVTENFQAIYDGGGLSARTKSFMAAAGDMIGASHSVDEVVAQYTSFKTPGGIQYGDRDAVLDPAIHGKALAEKAPHLAYEILPGKGHMTPMTAPEACADFIRRMDARGDS